MGWAVERKAGLVACGLVVVGAFLPWATVTTIFGSVAQTGVDGGDGWFTAGAAALSALAFATHRRGGYLAAVVLGVLVVAVALVDVVDVQGTVDEVNRESDGFARASTGAGLWLTLFAGIGFLVLAGRCLPRASRPTRVAAEVLPPPHPTPSPGPVTLPPPTPAGPVMPPPSPLPPPPEPPGP